MEKTVSTKRPYDSNPFRASIDGLVMILTKNPMTLLLTTVVGGLIVGLLYLFAILFIGAGATVFGVIVLIAFLVAMILLGAANYVIAAKSATGESITATQAFNIAKDRALPFVGMSILLGLAIGVGMILLIVPGLYLAGRLALAPIAFFAEGLGAVDSIKRSWALTSGTRVVEVLGATISGSLLSGGGLIGGATVAGPMVNRYHAYTALEKGGTAPKVHYLNWVAIGLVALFLVGYLMLIAIAVSAGINERARDKEFNDRVNMYQDLYR